MIKSVDIGLTAHYKFMFIKEKLPLTIHLRNFHFLLECTWSGHKDKGVPLIQVLKIKPSAKGTKFINEKSGSLDLLGIYLDQSLDIFFGIIKNSVYLMGGRFFDKYWYDI